MKKLNRKDLISLDILSTDEVRLILDTAIALKKEYKKKGKNKPILKDKILAMVFEKASLRTRVTFEVAMMHLGGQAIYLSQTNFKLGERESVPDVIHNLERWVDCVMLRTFAHQNLITMGECSTIPIINGLSDDAHPCQALADILTFMEHKSDVRGKKMVYVGDGNNVATSLAYACAHLGINFVSASPEGYLLPSAVVDTFKKIATNTGATIEVTTDHKNAVQDADCIYTDVWTSMGQEAEKEKRLNDFKDYQVNQALLSLAKKDAIVLHCLPAHRGEEITDGVMDGAQAAVFDQAENRLHAQKAVLALLIK